MGRNKKLPKGIRRKNGGYEARAQIDGKKVCVYGDDLEQVIENFEAAKNRIRCNMDYDPDKITLDQWYGIWFNQVKIHKIKETSIAPMNMPISTGGLMMEKFSTTSVLSCTMLT